MSEAKNKERPTIAVSDPATPIDTSLAQRRGIAASTSAAGRSEARPAKDVTVTARMTVADAAALDLIQTELGAGSRPDAVREMIRVLSRLLGSSAYEARKTAEPVIAVDPVVLGLVREAFLQVTESYNRRAREIHYIGHNWNQLAKVANATGAVDADALASVARSLAEMRSQMAADAQRDDAIMEATGCL